MKAEVWDARRCVLGEGPVVRGSEVFWVDILGKRVLSRNIESEQITEFDTHDHVSFVLPRAGGELMLGIADGPYLRNVDGALHRLPGRVEADGHDDPNPTRWNDAKVSPTGETWLGSMTYDVLPHEAALYRLSQDGASIKRILSEVTLSNGLGWSRDGTRFFYIDTPTRRVDVFDVVSEGITNRRTFIDLSSTTGMPDGLAVDAEDGVWVAFWDGGAVRRYDGQTGVLTAQIDLPVPRVTSCAFIGAQFDQMVITTARADHPSDDVAESGMTFIAQPGVSGLPTWVFTE
jgi:sugar lactone lactonase YvrE